MGRVEDRLREKLTQTFRPTHLTLENESPRHGLGESEERHFRLVITSKSFENQSRLERHRQVHETLAEELKGPVHALSVQAYTPKEWEKANPHQSPECAHKG